MIELFNVRGFRLEYDNLPENTIMCIGYKSTTSLNAPYSGFSGDVISTSYQEGAINGKTQIAISGTNRLLHRIKWGVSGVWTNWIENAPKANVYYVGGDSEHQSLTQLFIDLANDTSEKIIYVNPGTYDIYQEYRDAQIPTPPDDVTSSDYLTRCVFVPPNTKLIGIGNVTLEWNPAKNDIAKGEARTWSPLNVRYACHIENITIHCKYGRYCIHDDSHNAADDQGVNHTYKNVKCIYEYSEDGYGFNNTIGFGFSQKNTYLFEDCYFENRTTGSNAAFYGHGASGTALNADESPSVTIKNCIIAGGSNNNRVVRLQSLNKSPLKIKTLFEGCYIDGGVYLTLYYDDAIQAFDVTLKDSGSPKQTVDNSGANIYPIKIYETANTANASDIADLQAYVGYTDNDIVGLQVDFENKTFTRLAGAVGKSAGADFDSYPMFGGRKRCNVLDDGTITAYYGDGNYTEDGSNGQVMVYQPAFYYNVVPLKLDKNTDSGIGYHIRKANYYVSATPHAGFKLHPAFYDESGNAVDYILYSAYEGSLYKPSVGKYITDDSDTSSETDLSSDLICSVSGVKPITGRYKNLSKQNFEALAVNRGAGWHCDTVKSVSANQILMMIELGTMNTQSAVGRGVTDITDGNAYNCCAVTGATSTLGNTTGQAIETMITINGSGSLNTEPGKLSVSYRGVENPWGNIWKHIQSINVWGNGAMAGGQPYVADDSAFIEAAHSGNYKPVGFTLPNANGYINALGYGCEKYDWLLMPSEIGGTSSLPVGDYTAVSTNLDGYKIALFGGAWSNSSAAGGFYWYCTQNINTYRRDYGARLLYIPTATI